MNKAEELLEEANCLLMEVHSGNVIGGEESQQSYDLQEEISNYLNRKNKLVVGSEWVCDVECFMKDYGGSTYKLSKYGDFVAIEEVKNDVLTISSNEMDDWGIIGIDQFLACFSPKEETNE